MSHALKIVLLHAQGLRNYEIAKTVGCAPNTVVWHLSTRGLLANKATTCVQGHEFTPANTRVTKEGSRACRACHREANRAANGWQPREPRTALDHEFFERLSPESAWLAGLLAADGCITSHRAWELSLSGEPGRELVQTVADLIGHKRPLGTHKTSARPSYRISVSSARQVRALADTWMVTPRKSLTLAWPNPPVELVRPFLRGYVDGDGHVAEHRGAAHFSFIGTPEFVEAARSVIPVEGGSFRRFGPRTISFGVTHRKARTALAWLYHDDDLPSSYKAIRARELTR